jgi:peptidoglycan/xylan/chitin deacetylase (PgdA/CDA1 family)
LIYPAQGFHSGERAHELSINALLRHPLLQVRVLLLLVILAGGWSFASAAQAQDYATVFVYHRFGDARYPSTNISVEQFEKHLRYLRDNEYNVVPLSEITAILERGENFPPRCVGLSADDAYASVLHGAVPLLDEYSMPMTVFVNTDAVGGGSYMDWNELRKLDGKSNIEIGNHSARHPYYVSLDEEYGSDAWAEQVREDISTAQQAFETHLGYSPELFAYPYGEFSPALKKIVADMGFRAAFGQQSGPVGDESDLFALARFPMGGNYVSMERLRSSLSMHPLDIEIIRPDTPFVASEDEAPQLVFKIENPEIQVSSMTCYIPGQDPVTPQVLDEKKGIYQVQAQNPLQGRRSKYTLTVQDRDNRWYWFSHLWINPAIEERYAE